MDRFLDRRDGGRRLARRLVPYANRTDVVVLALPRGGVPVGYEVAAALHAPLEVIVVRKLGAPWNEEFAIGALASGGVQQLAPSLIRELHITRGEIALIVDQEQRELARRERVYHGTRPFPDLQGRVVILVDDGLATGASMLAAVEAVRRRAPASIVVATPVASEQACEAIRRVADVCVALMLPEPLYGIGMYYADFSPTTDEEVLALLDRAAHQSEQTVVSLPA